MLRNATPLPPSASRHIPIPAEGDNSNPRHSTPSPRNSGVELAWDGIGFRVALCVPGFKCSRILRLCLRVRRAFGTQTPHFAVNEKSYQGVHAQCTQEREMWNILSLHESFTRVRIVLANPADFCTFTSRIPNIQRICQNQIMFWQFRPRK